MGDISDIFGGPYIPPAAKSPVEQLYDAIRAAGMTPPDKIFLDGKLHRFEKDKVGWYVAFSDGIPAGRFGNWKVGMESTWRADISRDLTPAEQMGYALRMAEAKAIREIEQKKTREVAADIVDTIWTKCGLANPDHPYLKAKGISPHGARVTGDGRLVVPLFNLAGELTSLQYIDKDGGKLYHSGGQTGGCFWMLGDLDPSKRLYIAEGFATAATIHEITECPVAIAYSASNLVPVTASLRDLATDIVIVADNDASGVGQKYADQASAKYGVRVIMTPSLGDANDYMQSGGDLMLLLNPVVDDWIVEADDFCLQPAPIKWLVKNWIQDQALIMVHGPSGGGKTFVVLDWCLHMAAGLPDWIGHKVKPASIIYLAGEGHYGLRGRIAAWKERFHSGKLHMGLSKSGCDLNTAGGYHKVVDHIRARTDKPSIIVVDTLHRFLSGDENSAQDAKTMLDACGALMREFNCSVILVHHTGVSEEAQHRARGSSAWKGALDIEISIVPATDDQPMQIVQRKSKDAEMAKTVYVHLESVSIPNWIDEDGEQVTSAVIVPAEAPVERTKVDPKVKSFRDIFIAAWWESGKEERENAPYVSRSALKSKLTADGKTERTASNMMEPNRDGGMISTLLDVEFLDPIEHGWIIIDSITAMTLRAKKSAPSNPLQPPRGN